MPRQIVLVLVGLIFAGSAATPVIAAEIGLGGPGLGFSCDVDTRVCKCKGTWSGADCQAMKKNCASSGPFGSSIKCPKGANYCTCTLAKRNPTSPAIIAPSGGLKVQNPPPTRNPAIIEQGAGAVAPNSIIAPDAIVPNN